MRVSAESARRFLVARQLLAPARSVAGGPEGVLEVVRQLGSLQFDPLAVAGRSHDLVLHARVANYDPACCDLLFEQRELVEAFNKGLSLVRTSDFPWFRANLGQSSARVLAENTEVAERVLQRISDEGPLSALDFERQRGETVDWFGAPTNVVRAVLEAYAVTGVLGLSRRDGDRRFYDLLERLLPPQVLGRKIELAEQLRFKLLSRYRAHGLLGIGGGGGIFGGIGPAKPSPARPDVPGRTALREELIEDGELVPVDVEGVRGKRFVLRDEVELLAAPSEPPPSVAFLSPFDPLIWDRALLGSLFDFDYVWELFHPRRSGAGAGTCCRSSSATASSRASSHGSIARSATSTCSACGGKTTSSRGAPRVSWMRCAMLSAPISASRKLAASSGGRSSRKRSDSSPLGREMPCQYSSPASTNGLRPHANVVSYHPVIGVSVVPKRDECTIQPPPT